MLEILPLVIPRWISLLVSGASSGRSDAQQLNAPPSQRQLADSRTAQDVRDQEFRLLHLFPAAVTSGPVSFADSDLQQALRLSITGWPPCETLFPIGDPAWTENHPAFSVDLRGLPPTRAFVCESREGTVADAL